MLGWTFLWPEPDYAKLETADAIVCLGGGMSPDGTLAASVLTRIQRCVDIYDAGLGRRIIFTGGTAAPNGPNAGAQMASYAQTLGLPADRILIEGRAQSTLQNALFALELAGDAQDFIIVSEAFHLPRSWASFRWAWGTMGIEGQPTFQLVMSEPVRRDPATGTPSWRMLGRESLAIWFNGARAIVYSLAPDPKVDWLSLTGRARICGCDMS